MSKKLDATVSPSNSTPLDFSSNAILNHAMRGGQ
jgi:hypothetical protein